MTSSAELYVPVAEPLRAIEKLSPFVPLVAPIIIEPFVIIAEVVVVLKVCPLKSALKKVELGASGVVKGKSKVPFVN